MSDAGPSEAGRVPASAVSEMAAGVKRGTPGAATPEVGRVPAATESVRATGLIRGTPGTAMRSFT